MPVRTALGAIVTDRSSALPPTNDALKPKYTHQPPDREVGHDLTLAAELPPDLPRPVDPEVVLAVLAIVNGPSLAATYLTGTRRPPPTSFN